MSPLYSNKAPPFLKPRFVNMPYPVDKEHNFQNQKSKFCLSEENNTPLGLSIILTMIRQFFVSCHSSTPSKFWKNDFLPKTDSYIIKTNIVSSAQKSYKLTWIPCLLLVWMSHRMVKEGYLKMMFKWWKGSAQNPSTSLCSLNVAIWEYMST